MASKKDFGAVNTEKANTGAESGAVYESIERGEATRGQQGTANKEEQAERAAEFRTQGRKGCRLKRINFSFSDANYDYVRTVSRATGQGMTRFLNQIIDDYRNTHPEIYEQSKAVLAQVQAITDSNTEKP